MSIDGRETGLQNSTEPNSNSFTPITYSEISLPSISTLPHSTPIFSHIIYTILHYSPLPFPDIECKVVYVGSAESEQYDQVLDSILVGPVPAGRHMFVFKVRVSRQTHPALCLKMRHFFVSNHPLFLGRCP